MMEKVTIGGINYESIGSSSSNLLLKCNGTARIQWGNKLIDLIKDGKIASGSNSGLEINIISEESKIKSDGIYILNSEENSTFIIKKNGKCYNLNGTELYISTTNKQEITAEQKQQAGKNLGLYFDNLEEVKNSNVQNGLVYTLNTKKLYAIQNGAIEEFLIELQPVAVEQTNTNSGESINSSSKIVPGMIMMYSGMQEIPEGWALCDGLEHVYNNVTTVTPNLVEKFIRYNDSVENYEVVFIIKL
jgi:hypothetical protein